VLVINLLGEAEDLIEQDVHATTIVEGYHEASEIALEAIAEQVNEADVDDEILRQVAESCMTGKGTGGLTAKSLAETVVEAIRHVDTDEGVARDNITVHTQVGASSNATELVPGIIVDEEPVHDGDAHRDRGRVDRDSDVELGVRTGDVDAEYAIDSIDQLNAAIDAEEGELEGYAQTVADSGRTSSSPPKTSTTASPTPLANEDILVRGSRRQRRPTGRSRDRRSPRRRALEDLEDADFGSADRIHTERFGDDDLAFVEGGAAAETVTVFVRGRDRTHRRRTRASHR